MCSTTSNQDQIEAANKEKELQDVSVPIYKILSCVRQMDQAFNRAMIIATLRGVKEQTLFQLELHRIAAYGSLVRYSEKQIEQLIQLLFDKGALWETVGRYQSVKLGEPARALLEKKQPVFTQLVARQDKK